MPTLREIYAGLHLIANDATWVAVAWHLAAAVAVALLLAGLRPSRRVAAATLSVPLASVSIVAFVFNGLFNGAVFAILAVVLAAFASRASTTRAALGSRWAVLLGATLIAFGWAYPHFLEGVPWYVYLYRAPLGTIPCPTLSAVVGTALLANGFGLSAWRMILAGAASFYSLFGMLRLGVAIDAMLLVGGIGLIGQHLQNRRGQPRRLDVAAT